MKLRSERIGAKSAFGSVQMSVSTPTRSVLQLAPRTKDCASPLARSVTLDQKRDPGASGFKGVGTYRFAAGKKGKVTIFAAGANGYVLVDAVQFLPVIEPKRR